MRIHAPRAASIPLLILLILAACGDDDGPTDPGNGSGEPIATGTVDGSGGTLDAADGSFALTIPPGALAAATQITVREVTPVTLAFGTALRSFDFEPDDIVFSDDVTMTVSLIEALPRIRARNFEAATPIVVVSDEEILDASSIERALDHLAKIPNDSPNATEVQFDLRNAGDRFVSILIAGASIEGGNTYTFTVEIDESTPDAITQSVFGGSSVVDFDFSAPPNFVPSSTVPTSFLSGDGELISATIADGDPLTFVNSGVDGQTGRQLSSYQLEISVEDGLQDGQTARLDYGLRYTYDADFSDYWDGDRELLSFTATYEHRLGTLEIPVEIEEEPEGFRPGVWSVGAAVDGLTFAAHMDGWRFEDAIFVTTGVGTRVLDTGFTALTSILNDNGAYGAFVAGWREEPATTLPEGIALFRYGNGLDALTGWNYELDDFTFTQLDVTAGNVTDISPYDGNPLSGGVVKVQERAGGTSRVNFIEFDGQFWSSAGILTEFPDALGPAITGYRRSMGPALIATGGETSQLYMNEMGPSPGASTLIGTLGDDVRQMRFSGEIGFASLRGSGTIRPILWPTDGNPTILDPVPVGAGPISFDLMRMENDNRVLVSAGFDDDTLWRTEFTSTGTLVSNTSWPLPSGVEGPSTVRFVPGNGSYVAVNGFDTGNVAIVDLGGGQ